LAGCSTDWSQDKDYCNYFIAKTRAHLIDDALPCHKQTALV
jgi:hypothetical protein